ncbi:MAG: hypothetical protein AB7O67_23855, partial [Vicinamibacterales bacterium]
MKTDWRRVLGASNMVTTRPWTAKSSGRKHLSQAKGCKSGQVTGSSTGFEPVTDGRTRENRDAMASIARGLPLPKLVESLRG